MNWTEQAIARLEQLWADGDTATQIGVKLGCNKNQVLGKVHRLRLPARKAHPNLTRKPAAEKPRPAGPAHLRLTSPAQAKLLGPRDVIDGFVSASTPRIPVALRLPIPGGSSPHTDCQWPVSQSRPWEFCKCATVPGFSWCAEHKARVFERRAA